MAVIAIFFCAILSAQTPKYIFFFIGDGMGSNQVYMTDVYNRTMGREGVNFYDFPVFRTVSTHSANSLVTDSAAAGSALAMGVKTVNGRLGNDPDNNPVRNITEIAKANGLATGIVTSVGVNHATPGAFFGHVKSRNDLEELADQLIESDVDFVAGGHFMTGKDRSSLSKEEWVAKAQNAGITVFEGKGAYKATKGRVILLGNNGHSSLSYAIDRKEGETELADFTSAAIRHLCAASKKGFFLMVEGGKIDYGCHGKDAATTIAEINDMAKSVQLALDFAAKHPKETLIIVTADHETAGCALGAGSYELHPEFIQYQKCSKDQLTEKLYSLVKKEEVVSWPSVKAVLSENLGFWKEVEVSKKFEARLTQRYKEAFLDNVLEEEKNLYSSNSVLAAEAVDYLQTNKARITWPFSSHSGAPVGLYVHGAGAQAFNACRDNADVPKTIVKVAKLK